MGSRVKEREKRKGENENATRKKICREVERKMKKNRKKDLNLVNFHNPPINVINFTFDGWKFIYVSLFIVRLGQMKRDCQEVINFDHSQLFLTEYSEEFVYIRKMFAYLLYAYGNLSIRDICSSRILETKGQTKS